MQTFKVSCVQLFQLAAMTRRATMATTETTAMETIQELIPLVFTAKLSVLYHVCVILLTISSILSYSLLYLAA